LAAGGILIISFIFSGKTKNQILAFQEINTENNATHQMHVQATARTLMAADQINKNLETTQDLVKNHSTKIVKINSDIAEDRAVMRQLAGRIEALETARETAKTNSNSI
jgi:hypothetical protein